MKRLDLSNDYTDLYDFVAKRAKSFDPTTNPGPGRGQRVSRIGLGFDASDGGWACLVFDTRQNPKADIRWKESIDETGLRRPRWAKAYTALKAGPLALALHDGRKQDLPAGDTASLVAALGELMRVVLLQARNDGAFAALPKTPRCDLAVEDQAGSFCWPASGSDNRADPPGVGGQFALAADTKRVRDASRKRPAKRRLIPENDLEPLRAQVEQLADERDYAFPGLCGLPFYHAIV